jgi:Competence protein/Domain of unknown function (DUF4131)
VKLPAVAITAAFACGIALGLCPPIARLGISHLCLIAGFVATVLLVVIAISLLSNAQLGAAAIVSGLAWMLLGLLGAWISEQPLPSNHVIALIETGKIDLHTPLRWRGRLRDEPTKLPWGYVLEVELSGVNYESASFAAQGGLRLSYLPRPEDGPLPELHAGDEVTVIAQVKRPQVFRDEGAFDWRAYLASQGIDLVATLRSAELIERVSVAPLSVASALARVRHRLREEIDALFDGRPQVAAVLRAMLLGDRSFIERDEAVDFQKTGVFHVLVVAGLHVGALAFFLYWIGRKLRLSRPATMVFTLTTLFAYIAVIEQRPPVLRAALMAAIVVLGGFFYRRLDVLKLPRWYCWWRGRWRYAIPAFSSRFWQSDASRGWRGRGWKEMFSRMRERCADGATSAETRRMSRGRRSFELTCERRQVGSPVDCLRGSLDGSKTSSSAYLGLRCVAGN